MGKFTFSREDTKLTKGLAIFLMLLHHLWRFPNRIIGGELKHLVKIFGQSSLIFLGGFGKICVSLFFFLGGYGIYMLSKKEKFNMFGHIKKLFINYWKVFFIMVPIGFIFFSKQIQYVNQEYITNRFAVFSLKEFFANLLSVSYSYNYEWWFLRKYLVAIISFPLMQKIFEKRSTAVNILIIIVLTILMKNVLPVIGTHTTLGTMGDNALYQEFFIQIAPYVSCFWLGMLFAKDNLMVKLRKKLDEVLNINIFTDIIGVAIIIYLRQTYVAETYDIFYVPFLVIFFLDFIKRFKLLSKLFLILGQHSTNMWLTHSFFCYYFCFFANAVIYFKWGIPCLIVLIIFSLTASYIIDTIWNILDIFQKFMDKKIYQMVKKLKEIKEN